MSTQTENRSFAKLDAAPKPTLFCVGVVGNVGTGHLSSTEKYIVQPIELEALGSGRNQKVYLLYRPEWFTPEFQTAANLRSFEKNYPSSFFVYRKNIVGDKKKLSLLRALCGSDEAFAALSNQLLNLPVPEGTDGPAIEDVSSTLKNFFADNIDKAGNLVKVGYIMRQESVGTGEFDKNGKQIYILTDKMKVDSYWDVTSKQIEYFTKRAATSDGKSKMTFEV